jgi:hypothetical protein
MAIALIAAAAVEACAGAEPVRDAIDDAAALPDPGVGVMLAVDALWATLREDTADEAPLTEPVWTNLSVPAVTVRVNLPISVPS